MILKKVNDLQTKQMGIGGMGIVNEFESDFRKARRLSTGVEAIKSLTMGGMSVNVGLQFQRLKTQTPTSASKSTPSSIISNPIEPAP